MAVDDYPDEKEYLATVIEFLDKEIKKRKARSPARGPYKEDARSLQEMDDKAIADYERIRPRPYFGRVDFSSLDGAKVIKGYIGTDHVPRDRVYSWASPFAGQLFYANPEAVSGWDAPKGHIRGEILLKRQFAIDDARLLDVTEVYQLPSPLAPQPVQDPAEAFLIRRLSGSRGRKLGEAIATIQPEQYQQIAATPSEVMFIQGVAGSGKSIVGLHRIAYLLSPFHERPDIERIDPSQVVFFGPTRNFLRYVSNLLPSLNIRSVRQVAVADWVMDTIVETVKLDPKDPLLEKLLRFKGQQWQDAHHAAKLKGSLQMARTIDRYIEAKRKEILAKSTGVAISIDSVTPLILDARRVHREAASMLAGPLNVERRAFIIRLTALIWDLYFRAHPNLGERSRRQKQQQLGQRVRLQVQRQVSEFWPRLDSRQEYKILLASPNSKWGTSRGQLARHERAVLAKSVPKGTRIFTVEDLGPLCYLDHHLNQHHEGEFQHVVLDEAQEVSPIELLEMKRHNRSNGFTILGDLTQSLSPQGIDAWQETLRLFRGKQISRSRVRTSYRATLEVTRFANRLLKRVSPRAVTAIPFKRRGPAPSFSRSRDYKSMVTSIAADITGLKAGGMKTIGILCKNVADAKRLHDVLSQIDVGHVGLLARDKTTVQNVVVGPVSLTRGLEYDAVILAGAGKANYPLTPLHGKILYLAVSRAVHELRIHWIGQPAPQLPIPKTPDRKRAGRRRGRARASRNPRMHS